MLPAGTRAKLQMQYGYPGVLPRQVPEPVYLPPAGCLADTRRRCASIPIPVSFLSLRAFDGKYSTSTLLKCLCAVSTFVSSSAEATGVKAFEFRYRDMYGTCMGIMAKELLTCWLYQNYSESESDSTSEYTAGFQPRGFGSEGGFGVLGNFKPIFLPEGEEERFAFDLFKVIHCFDLYGLLYSYLLSSRL